MSVRTLSNRLARLERSAPARTRRGGSILKNRRFWDMLCGAAQNVTDAEQVEWEAIWREADERRDAEETIEQRLAEEVVSLAELCEVPIPHPSHLAAPRLPLV